MQRYRPRIWIQKLAETNTKENISKTTEEPTDRQSGPVASSSSSSSLACSSDQEQISEAIDRSQGKKVVFEETSFITVTAYQNQQVNFSYFFSNINQSSIF